MVFDYPYQEEIALYPLFRFSVSLQLRKKEIFSDKIHCILKVLTLNRPSFFELV